jgi:hypothetical protein
MAFGTLRVFGALTARNALIISVMAELVPAIHVFKLSANKAVDARPDAGHGAEQGG